MKEYTEIYDTSIKKVLELTTGTPFYDDFLDTIKSSDHSFSMYKRYMEKKIDIAWIDAIESAIPHLDKAMRNPRKFIKNEEEILPVELTKKVTPEAIKHLAQHTNLISRIDGDEIIPSHLLNVFKEESYETYENRFVYTLLNRLYLFVQKRYEKIFSVAAEEDISILKMQSQLDLGNGEKINYKLEIESTINREEFKSDLKNHSALARVEKLRRIILDFTGSSFAKIMKEFSMVRPPIMRTNAILKDASLKNCLNLWLFIEAYDKVGYEIISSDGVVGISEGYSDDLYSVAAIHCALMKKYLQTGNGAQPAMQKRPPLKPVLVQQMVEQLVDLYDFDQTQIQKIFSSEVSRVASKKVVRNKTILTAIDLALEKTKTIEKEKIRAILELEKEEKERIRLQKLNEKEIERKALLKLKKKKDEIAKFEKANENKKSSARVKARVKLEKKLKKIDDED